MDLSVIIVNYNVRHFLEQCLHSVDIAARQINCEIFVVDNNSVDGSLFMIREKFPQVRLIENKENLGFSKACNQALMLSSGKYCLLLNPDTVVEDDTFIKCIRFMEEHPEGGALGVKMIDGKGRFLPESKRSLPSPSVAFYKIFGLSAIFPSSRTFGRYHLTFLNKEETNPVEILSGAFMFIRKEALDKTGNLDEDFFMYGEDIDLSYRLIKSGYVNYYFPKTTIIHYKGQSTKEGTINYVILFYKAMIIFARKHYAKNRAGIFTFFMKLAIYFRALLSILRRLIRNLMQPFLDILIIYSGFLLLSPLWGKYKFGTEDYYPGEFFIYAVPAYILVWILSVYFSGGYEKQQMVWKTFRGYLAGTLIILVIYALLPEKLRFSRALILLGSLWGLLMMLIQRLVFHFAGLKNYKLISKQENRQIIIGLKEEAERISLLIEKTHLTNRIIGFVSSLKIKDPEYLGDISQLSEIIRIHKIDEIIFCARDVSSREIIRSMVEVSELPVTIKIAAPESLNIIGTRSVITDGDLYNLNFNSVGKFRNRIIKRIFDFVSAIIIIISYPVLFVIFKTPLKTFRDSLKVISGFKTWISYDPAIDISSLPNLKAGVFNPSWNIDEPGSELTEKLNMEYARDYRLTNDLIIVCRNIFRFHSKN